MTYQKGGRSGKKYLEKLSHQEKINQTDQESNQDVQTTANENNSADTPEATIEVEIHSVDEVQDILPKKVADAVVHAGNTDVADNAASVPSNLQSAPSVPVGDNCDRDNDGDDEAEIFQ